MNTFFCVRRPLRALPSHRVAAALLLAAVSSGLQAQGSASATTVAAPTRTAVPPSAVPTLAQSLACLIEPHQVVELGSPVIGVLEDVAVERGQRVAKGQVVATLQADVERRNAEMAHTRMDADAELAAAQSNHDLARRNHERTESLVKQNFLSSQALDQSRADAEIAERKVARAREQRRLAQTEYRVAQAQLAQRLIRSPIDGVVVDKYLSLGERVDERPILKIATINPLRIEVIVPAVHHAKFKSGMAGTVMPELPGAPVRRAEVTVVDGVIDAASNTFRVRLKLDNADGAVPAGARCRVAFDGIDPTPGGSLAAARAGGGNARASSPGAALADMR